MIIVKITILLILITLIYRLIMTTWARINPTKIIKTKENEKFLIKVGCMHFVIAALDVIGIIASAIYLLFIR